MIYRATTFASVGLLFGWIGYMLSDRDIPVTALRMEAVPNTVAPGETITFHIHLTRHRSCQTTVNRFVYDSQNHRHVIESDISFSSNILPLGEDDFMVPLSVPLAVPEGRTIYRTINCYICNPTHKFFPLCDAARDIPFEVKR